MSRVNGHDAKKKKISLKCIINYNLETHDDVGCFFKIPFFFATRLITISEIVHCFVDIVEFSRDEFFFFFFIDISPDLCLKNESNGKRNFLYTICAPPKFYLTEIRAYNSIL